eukprot:sb/3463515/
MVIVFRPMEIQTLLRKAQSRNQPNQEILDPDWLITSHERHRNSVWRRRPDLSALRIKWGMAPLYRNSVWRRRPDQRVWEYGVDAAGCGVSCQSIGLTRFSLLSKHENCGQSIGLTGVLTTNQNSLFRSRDWLSANQGSVFAAVYLSLAATQIQLVSLNFLPLGFTCEETRKISGDGRARTDNLCITCTLLLPIVMCEKREIINVLDGEYDEMACLAPPIRSERTVNLRIKWGMAPPYRKWQTIKAKISSWGGEGGSNKATASGYLTNQGPVFPDSGGSCWVPLGHLCVEMGCCLSPPLAGPSSHGRVRLAHEPTETSKQPIRTRYLGHVTGYQPIGDQTRYFRHVTGYQPIRDQYFLHLPSLFGVTHDIWFAIEKRNTQEPTDTSKQPIRTRYLALGHVTGYQPIRDQYFFIRSVPDNCLPVVCYVLTPFYKCFTMRVNCSHNLASCKIGVGLPYVATPKWKYGGTCQANALTTVLERELGQANALTGRGKYLGHVTGYQPIRNQCFLVRSVPIILPKSMQVQSVQASGAQQVRVAEIIICACKSHEDSHKVTQRSPRKVT